MENVRSFGTEGRKHNPEEEVAASDQVYEYIVFRGSDVKDLRIEQGPSAPKENKPPVPDDPAILGVSLHSHRLSHLPSPHYDEIFPDEKQFLSEKRKKQC